MTRYIVFPFVLYDHNGFATEELEGEPTFAWPEDCLRGDDEWVRTVLAAGPPFYGVPMAKAEGSAR